ncbi:MAG: hypothetical protein WCI38_00225 [Chthoniobacterales bacterium]|jgi:hypothetical protein
MSWRIYTHHTLKAALRSVQILLFAMLPAAILWLEFAGVPPFCYPPLIEAAKKEGLELSFSRMRLSMMQGAVLDKVRLSASGLPTNGEVAVDHASIALNWGKLLRGAVELTALELQGAQLYLPMTSADGVIRSLRLTKARARLVLVNGIVSVPLAKFNLQGIDVTASGQVALGRSGTKTSTATMAPAELARGIEIIESLDFGPSPPRLDLEFSVDAGRPESWHIPIIRFTAAEAAYKTLSLRDLRLEASLNSGLLDVQNFSARDKKGGMVNVSGSWETATGAVQASLESNLDPVAWVKEFGSEKEWGSLVFSKSPVVRATLETSEGEPRKIRILGTAEAGPFTLRGLKFAGLDGGFSWRNAGEFFADDVTIRLQEGDIRADVMVRPDEARVKLDCRADPTPLVTLLGEKARESIGKMELAFLESPHIVFEARGSKLDIANMSATGMIKLGRTSIHGSTMESGSAQLAYKDRELTFSAVSVTRPEGTGSGAFIFDFAHQQVRLEGIHSTMNPFDVLQWADPKVAKETIPYRFKGTPDVTVNGVIGLKDPGLTQLTADFTIPQGLDYDLLERTLNFGAARGTLRFKGRRIELDAPAAKLFGGQARISANIITGQAEAPQQMSIDLDKVNFETLTRLYFDYKDSKGVVSGRYKFTFVPGKAERMRGQGNLLVENGNVFAIPVLGPLSLLLDSVVPGAGYQTSRKATCDFRVANAEIRTDNLDVQGQGFAMLGQGALFFLEDRMDFGVRVNAKGVPGLLLYPVSKLFEYVSDGRMSEPKWRPRMLPKGGAEPKPTPDEPKPKETSGATKPRGRV